MPQNNCFTLINAQLILSDCIVKNGWLQVQDGLIHSLGHGTPPQREEAATIDANGLYVAPGFIDLHVHGGGGSDFRDADPVAYRKVLQTHLQGGTTALLATLSASTHATTLACLHTYNCLQQALQKENNAPPLPRMLGVHLEGPYFAKQACGAQEESIIRAPDCNEMRMYLHACKDIRRVAIAPELPGALAVVSLLQQHGVTVCAGHSTATTQQLQQAFAHGVSCVTHLYSSCSMVHRNGPFREGGIVEGAFLLPDMDVEVIADGCHLPCELLQLIYQIKGAHRIALITDSTRGGGMAHPDGTVLNDDIEGRRTFLIEAGVAMLPDKTSFAGSIPTTARLVRTMVHLAGIPLHEAVRMATLTPARMAGVQDVLGSLTVAKNADLLLFDENIHIKKVWIHGHLAVDLS